MSKFKITSAEPPGFKEVEYIKLFDEAGETWALHMSFDKYIVSHYKTGYQVFGCPRNRGIHFPVVRARALINYYEHRILEKVTAYPTLNES